MVVDLGESVSDTRSLVVGLVFGKFGVGKKIVAECWNIVTSVALTEQVDGILLEFSVCVQELSKEIAEVFGRCARVCHLHTRVGIRVATSERLINEKQMGL